MFRSLLQKTYELYDTWFYDTGVTGTASTNWYEFTTSGTKTVTSTGTSLANTNSQIYMVYANKPGTSTDVYDYDSPFCVEFDIENYVTGTSNNILQMYSSQTGNGVSVAILQNGHYKVTYDGNTRRYWVDGVEKTPYDIVIGTARIGFVVYQGGSIKFKNFKIYPYLDLV